MEGRKKPNEGLESISAHLGAIQKGKIPQQEPGRIELAERDRKVAARVLARFKAMFPSFGSQLMNDEEMMLLTIDEWAKSLAGIDVNRIGQAIEQVKKSSAKWPPSLPEFVAMCQATSDPAHRQFLPAPPPKPADPEIARKGMEALRAILRR